jgi:hypothetical protein
MQKMSVVGIFDRFTVPQFPGLTAPCFVYVQMTSGIGHYQFSVEIRDTDLDQPIARSADLAQAVFKDRTVKQVLIIPIPPLPLPRAGRYDFIVFANGQEVDRQVFEAVQRPENPHGKAQRGPKRQG